MFYSIMVTLGVGHYTMNGPYYDKSGKFIDWVDVPCSNSRIGSFRWTTSYSKMLKGTIKVDVQKDVCHFALVMC